jgi:hypothetical protein
MLNTTPTKSIKPIRRGKRGLIVLTMAMALAIAPVTAGVHLGKVAAAASGYKITSQPFNINGFQTKIQALNTDNTTYVGVRVLNSSLGLKTQWDKAKQTVTVSGRDRVLVLDLKSGEAILNEQMIYGIPAIVQNNTTYVPFRFLLEQLGYGVSYDKTSHVIKVVEIQENDLKITTETIAQVDAKQSLRVNYPQLSGYANEEVQTQINDYLKKEAQKHADSGKIELAQAVRDNDLVREDNPEVTIPPVAYEGTYTVTYNELGKLSLYVNYYIYTGGAHGITVRVPYTFDLSNGSLLTLQEAANNAKYVSIINSEILSQIKARKIGMLNLFSTIAPDRDFFLKHNGIVVYFEQYEYTPYAEGMPEFEVSYDSFA